MNANALKIDLAMIPESGVKDALIHFARQHNALVDDARETKFDLENLIGKTGEEKELSQQLFQNIRKVFKLVHSKRFNVVLLSLQLYISGKLLQMFGINLEDFSRLVTLIKNL